MFVKRKTKPTDPITVPDRTRKRARKAIAFGHDSRLQWVEQTLFLIGQSIMHRRDNPAALDDAVESAEALLALLVEWRELEKGL